MYINNLKASRWLSLYLPMWLNLIAVCATSGAVKKHCYDQ